MPDSYHVVITDVIHEPDVEREVLDGIATVEPHNCTGNQEVAEAVRDADAVIIWHTVELRADAIAGMRRCRGIARCGVGYDNIDLKAAGQRGIWVSNVPDYGTEEVADHTIGMLIAVSRRFAHMDKLIKSGVWDFNRARPVWRLRGQTLGIIGFGRIGSAVSLRARPLGLRVLAHDPYLRPGLEKSFGVELVDLDTLLAESDFVTVHPPLTEETYHLMGEATLRSMKPTAYLINAARGPIVDEAALIYALRQGWIAGAALDVLEHEPPAPDNPLLRMDNVLLTPHSAFYSEESVTELRRKGAQDIARVLRGEPPRTPVNEQYMRRSALISGGTRMP
ncbi:MAG: C-terminal binding protein [Ardenticatenaceae bacterium]|nr:C-terminal binding protein [Ardenticatenaceae bacterium]